MKATRVIMALAAALLILNSFSPGGASISRAAGRSEASNDGAWKDEVRARAAQAAGRAAAGAPGKDYRETSLAEAEAVPGQFLVKPASGFFAADLEGSLASLGALILRELERAGLLLVELPADVDSALALELLGSLPFVQAVEPNLLRRFHALPNDSLIASQWYLSHINASAAWDSETGSASVVIADIDSGLRTDHEDFTTGIGSGRILPGYNSINGSTDITDTVGHGTWTAGCSSADTDNAKGIAGTGWDCSFLPIKAGDASGVSLAAEIDALHYAADQGADVINMSFGAHDYSAMEAAAVDYAVEQGCLIVSSRGNEGHDALDFPACLANVVGVGSTDNLDQPSEFTDYGMGTDVMAPGENIYTTDKAAAGSYLGVDGTSFSSPVAAGQAGLVLSRYPGLTAAEVEYLVEEGAAGMSDPSYGYGLINMAGSLTTANDYTDSLEPNNTVNQAYPIETGILQSYIGCNSDSDFYSFTPRETGMMAALLDDIGADCDYDLFLHPVDQGGDWEAIIASSTAGPGEPEGFIAPVQAGVEYALEVQCYYRYSSQPYTLGLVSPEIATDWYFAEGYTGAGFDAFLCLQNPSNTSSVTIDAEYMFKDGSTTVRSYDVGPHSRRTVNVNTEAGPERELSVHLSSTGPFIAERPMYFNYGGAWPGGHDLMGITTPSSTWFFAEGYTGAGFDEWLCLQNPNGWTVETEVFFTGPEVFESRTYALAPDSRTTISVNGTIGTGYDVSLSVFTSDGDGNGHGDTIVAERPMYFAYGGAWTGGHISSGTIMPFAEWYFAEGYTGSGFDEFLCLQNPNDTVITVTVDYMMEGGSTLSTRHDVGAFSRATVKVDDEVGPDKNVSVKASAVYSGTTEGAAFIAERPMYFDYRGKWPGGHVVTGAFYPSVSWFFAESYTGPGFEEWLCLQNPGTDAANLDIQYMLSDGTVIPQELTILPRSRSTVFVNDVVGADREFSIKVISDVPVVAERPIYFLYQGWCPGGDDVMGYTP